MEDKIQIDDINREFYDFRYEETEENTFRLESGLTPEIVQKISEEKGDPDWMREFRLKSLETYNQLRVPKWPRDLAASVCPWSMDWIPALIISER